MFEQIKNLLKKVNSPFYESMSDVYTKEQYIGSNEDLKEFNSEFITFFEKLLEVQIDEVQYVLLTGGRFGLLLKKITGTLKIDEIKEFLGESDYSYKGGEFVLLLDE